MRPRPDEVIRGKYRIVRLIGDGGMGTVYEARHQILGTPVALKFLHSELARRTGLAERFLQEARVSASIQSSHVARVTDVDTAEDGSPFLVMELLSGESLQDVLDRELKLSQAVSIDYGLQVLSGLEAAHALNVVHRDLKPDNVFITHSPGGPLLKLIDFGIAKLRASNEYQKGLTRAGVLMGTPEYMAPEQLYSAADVDHRADLYSLGVMLYEMLTGERPAYGDDATEIVGLVVQGKIKRLEELLPSVSPGLASIIHQAMAPDRDQRHESAYELRQALAQYAGDLSHAGRLAATPAPVTNPPPQVESASARSVPGSLPRASDAAPTSGAVPPTWPPDDDSPDGSAATEDDPALAPTNKGETQRAPALEPAVPPAQVPPSHHVSVTPAIPPGMSTAMRGSYVPTPPPPAKSRGALGAVLALLAGVVVTGGIIAGFVYLRQSNGTAAPDAAFFDAAPPETTISAEAPRSDAGAPPPFIDSPEAPAPTPRGPATPRRDGGTRGDAGPDAGFPTFPPIPLPSTLPPLPSGFPTAFPPSFPQIPGFPPPATESRSRDAGRD